MLFEEHRIKSRPGAPDELVARHALDMQHRVAARLCGIRELVGEVRLSKHATEKTKSLSSSLMRFLLCVSFECDVAQPRLAGNPAHASVGTTSVSTPTDE